LKMVHHGYRPGIACAHCGNVLACDIDESPDECAERNDWYIVHVENVGDEDDIYYLCCNCAKLMQGFLNDPQAGER